MKRPDFKDFYSEGTTVQDIQKAFTRHPELYRYITALDSFIDEIHKSINEELKKSWDKMGDTGSEQYQELLNEENFHFGKYRALEDLNDMF